MEEILNSYRAFWNALLKEGIRDVKTRKKTSAAAEWPYENQIVMETERKQ